MQAQPTIIQKSIQSKIQIPIFSAAEQEVVGISQYITNGKQIPAITKYLLSDFIVNQIDQTQTVVVLDNKPLTIKQEKQQKKVNYIMNKQIFQLISNNLTLEAAKSIQSLYQKLQFGQKIDWEFIMENISTQKSQRQKLHTFVRQNLDNIESNTLDGNKIRLKFNRKLRKIDPQSRHKYTHFKLYKSNIDTMSALFKLSKITGISQKVFSSAGLKDKRGITTQLISVFNSDINNLKKFYQQADRNRQIWIDGFIENQNDAIAVGCLYGNQFGLILRLLNPQDAQQVKNRVDTIQQNGIINYFGMQRFGSSATRTHLVGVRIIRREWKQLVEDLILEDTGSQFINNLKRDLYETKQYNKADRALSNKYKIQKSLFQGLVRHGTNYYNVFENLPRSMKTLYCHALQSYLWNKITSRRIRQHGLKLVVGDLVGVMTSQNKKKIQTFQDIIQKPNQSQQKPEQPKNQKQVNEQVNAEAEQQNIQDEQLQVSLITKQNIQNFTYFDLVAPLYGISIDLPQESIMNKYLEDELVKINLLKRDFEQKSKSLCFKGAYRKCIIKPPMISCQIISHKDKKADILSPFYMKDQKANFQQGELKSARIIVQLPKSSYATIAIRQILHIPSSFKVQSQLNNLYDRI